MERIIRRITGPEHFWVKTPTGRDFISAERLDLTIANSSLSSYFVREKEGSLMFSRCRKHGNIVPGLLNVAEASFSLPVSVGSINCYNAKNPKVPFLFVNIVRTCKSRTNTTDFQHLCFRYHHSLSQFSRPFSTRSPSSLGVKSWIYRVT